MNDHAKATETLKFLTMTIDDQFDYFVESLELAMKTCEDNLKAREWYAVKVALKWFKGNSVLFYSEDVFSE